METSIAYLNEVHGDLLAAARRQPAGGAAGGRSSRSPRGLRFPTTLVAAVASIVVLAGVIGALSRTDAIRTVPAGEGDAAGGAGATGATGETGAMEERESFGNLEGPVPQPTPAPGDDDAPVDVGQGISRVIRTADISVVIPRDAFDQRFAAAVDVAESNGGYVQDSRAGKRSGTLTIRVPAGNFDETLRALRGLGTVEVEGIHGRDVTDEYVDLRARLRIAKSRRAVLLELMQEATTIEQTIRVQNALDETQLRVEQIQGQLRLLDDRTSFATITLGLREQGAGPRVEQASIPNAFERAVAGFVAVIAAIVIGLGYLLPLVLIALVAWLVWTRVRARRNA